MLKALFAPLQLSLGMVVCLLTSPTLAQVTSDGTVNTQVNQNGNVAEITGGETRGDNLFHSFQDFSVPTNNEAFFNNADSIDNIFSRVTGGNISNIDGLIRANSTANLFLINPAGIVFGEGARLNIGGSFYGSTASSILFENGEFSAVDNLNQPILTINAPIGLSFRDEPGNITVEGITTESELIAPESALRVGDGNNLALLGGNINLNGGKIIASGGKVNLGGLLTAGEIEIGEDGSFNFPDGIERADVELTNFASVNVTAGEGGFINVNAKNLVLSQQSELFAGIAENMSFPEAQVGDIAIDATESVQLIGSGDSSFQTEIDDLDTAIRNHVGLPPQIDSNDFNAESPRNPESESTAIGNAGSIIVQTDRLEISARAALTSKIYGRGNTGNIQVTANEIVLNGGDILNQVREGGIGNAGNINVNTESLSAQNMSFIISDTNGVGDGGSVNINATEQFSFGGVQINTQIGATGEGNGGNISINTNNFSLEEGADIFADVIGTGNGGNIEINAEEQILLAGTDENFSEIFSTVGSNAVGNVGNISLNAKKLDIASGSIFSFTNGQGDAGNIVIEASEDVSLDGSNDNSEIGFTQLNVQVQSGGEGNAGDIRLSTNNLSLRGSALILANSSGNGDAGNIIIDSNTLSLSNSSKIQADTASNGNAGDINLNADNNIKLEDFSEISTRVISSGEGNAGDIKVNTSILSLANGSEIRADTAGNENAGNIGIKTQQLTVSDGAQIATGTSGQGNAGNLTVTASDSIKLAGQTQERRSGLVANAIESSGDGGNLTVDTDELTIEDGATITAGNFQTLDRSEPGTGEPGEIETKANSINLDTGGRIEASTQAETGEGAIINLQIADNITLRNDSFISAQAFGDADGGNLNIDSRFIIAFPSSGTGNDLIAAADEGTGGNVSLNVEQLFGLSRGTATDGSSLIRLSNGTNDIDISGSVEGSLNITATNIDPLQGATELPISIVEPTETTQQACAANREAAAQNGLNIAGKGGVPPAPDLPLSSLNTISDGAINPVSIIPAPIETAQGKIQLARGVEVTESGEIRLVAYRTNNAGDRIPEIKQNCGKT